MTLFLLMIQAETFLSRAVKLNPNLTDAWNALGECYFKKGDVDGRFGWNFLFVLNSQQKLFYVCS